MATALLDVGASPAHTGSFVAAIGAVGLAPIRCAVLTHWHWDHSFGGAALDVPIVAHDSTAFELATQAGYDWSDHALDRRVADGGEIAFCRDMLRLEIPDRSRLRIVLPVIVFGQRLSLDLGGVRVAIDHVGGDHAADSCVMHVEQDGLVFLGDCLYQRLYAAEPYLTVRAVRALVARIRGYNARIAIEGHLEELLDGHQLGRRLDELEAAAATVEQCGEASMDSARNDDQRELLGFFLSGAMMEARPDPG